MATFCYTKILLIAPGRRTDSESWHSAMEVWSSRLPPSPNYSEELSRTLCQHWPHTDPIWPLAYTRQSLVSLPVKRRSMSPTLIVISSDRLQGTMNNPHLLSYGQVTPQHRGSQWLLLLQSFCIDHLYCYNNVLAILSKTVWKLA